VKNRTAEPETHSERVLARALRLIQSDILPGKPDREGVRDLARICFPASDIADPGYFTWQYDQNPSGPAYELITKKGSAVTGHCAAIPMRHKIGPDICKGSLGVNVMTHPEFRGRGIYVILQREVDSLCGKDHIQFNFGFSNEYSQRNCLRRLGYREIGRFPLWILPFDLNRIAASRTPKQGLLMRAAAFTANPFWGLARAMFGLRRKDRSMEIETAAAIPEEFDRFWQKVQADQTNILVRDRAYLDWRFIHHPTRTYKVFLARAKGELRGYLVARMTTIEGISCGVLVDILTENTPAGKKAAGRLIAAFNRQARADGAAMGLCLMLRHSPFARALRRSGYVICPKPFLPRDFPIIVHWNMSGSPPAGLYDLKSWHMTLGDYDAI